MRRPKAKANAGRSPRAIRRGVLLGCFVASGGLIVGKAVKLQVIEHERWARAAAEQHREQVELPARRGAIYDRNGVPLALSQEMYQVSIAPGELREPRATARRLAEGLGLTSAAAEAAVVAERPWVVLPGRYTADQRRQVGSLRGVYFERSFERFYPQGDSGREIVGAVTRDGRALGGVEQQLDEVLRGEAGYTVLRRDGRGHAQPALSLPVVAPKDGASVHLTIDFDLQEIADGALTEAIATTGSSGGDLLIADPKTGELLAAVSRRRGRSRTLAAITEPYEPGSTLKPFLAAALLAESRATLADTVYAENGIWQDGARTFRDASPHAWLSLREALRVSSNIALVKFAKLLSPGQQYSYLRDFGFGTATGIEYPSESAGRLRRPMEWSRLSSGSLAIGYELSITPLQMLTAYGALANGGVLMEPYLIGEIRGSDGRLLARRSPRVLRRVIPEEVANAVTEVLVAVVEEGTATRASLSSFSVAGKTGTSRRTSGGSGYQAGAYTSTFVGYFPAQDPQIVIFVKLDEPRGAYFGGLTAAPVTRETLHGLLAVRTPAIDRRTLLTTRAAPPVVSTLPVHRAVVPGPSAAGTFVFLLSDGLPQVPVRSESPATVPPVEGETLRDAVRRVHAEGLTARVEGSGIVSTSRPIAGTSARRGDVVTLIAVPP